jgi:hypothetical protein
MKPALLFAAFTILVTPAFADNSATVRFEGFGPVNVGMSQSATAAALGVELVRTDVAGDIECEYLHAKNGWKGVEFMFSQGAVVRIDVMKGTTATASGIRIGDSLAKIKKAYPRRVEVTPHKYIPLPDGRYITVKAPDGKAAIRFETEKGRVTTYYAGRFPEVEYVEHCL